MSGFAGGVKALLVEITGEAATTGGAELMTGWLAKGEAVPVIFPPNIPPPPLEIGVIVVFPKSVAGGGVDFSPTDFDSCLLMLLLPPKRDGAVD